MKYKNLLLLLLAIFLFLAQQHKAEASTFQELSRQIEILKFEVSLLQSLLKNMQQSSAISAGSYIAVRLSDNSVLVEKNSNKTYSIGSITKLMTAQVLLENVDKEQKITLTEKMLEPLGFSPSLYFGLNVSAGNLLKASLIQSTNDAAESLSYFIGKQKFIQLMNKKAKEIGMANTIFLDPHGLSPQNISTAKDLVELLSYIYQNQPEILSTTKDNNFWLPDKTGTLLKFQNVNNFYPLPNFVGGKTGYLPEARQTFAGVFNVKGEPVAVVVLYSGNRQADVFSILRQLGN